MRIIKENLSSIVTCLAELVVGVLLLINPVAFTSGVIILLGILLLAVGIARIIRYFRLNALQAAAEQCMAKGLIAVLAGSFCVLCPDWFLVTFPVLTILYGLGTLLVGLFKVQLTLDALRMKRRWGWAAISALVTLAFAIVILCNPFRSTQFVWAFIAASLIVEALLDIVSIIFLAANSQKE